MRRWVPKFEGMMATIYRLLFHFTSDMCSAWLPRKSAGICNGDTVCLLEGGN